MPSPLSKALEKELTCSICTGLLFDPVTYLSCLHTNCGSCSKSWFLSQPTNPTCPECRKPVNDITAQAIIGSLIDVYLQHNPDQKPSEEDIRRARGTYKPGETLFRNGVFVATASSTTTATTATTSSPPSWASVLSTPPPPPPPPLITTTTPRTTRPPDPRRPRLPLSPTWAATQLDRAFSPPSTPQAHALESFLSFSLSPPRPGQRLPQLTLFPPPLRSITGIITHEQSPVHITCDLCPTVLDTKLHYECLSCRLFHLCLPCFRAGNRCAYPTHQGRWQKQGFEQGTAQLVPYVQTGLFCSVCTGWVDQARIGLMGPPEECYLWHCTGGCNDGKWYYCLSCVKLGNCCDHQLQMYSNNRSSSSENGVLRGSQPGRQITGLREDEKWETYFATCNKCGASVRESYNWFHCAGCLGADYDLCITCALRQDSGRCERGHEMISWVREEGRVRVEKRPNREVPEMCRDQEGVRAVALSENWPQEGTLGLMFPKRALLTGVRDAGDGLCWAEYCGMDGLFERGMVRILEE